MPDGKVIRLGSAALPGEIEADVVETLRELLARAESGEINGVAIAYTLPSGTSGTVFTTVRRYQLGGAILMLQGRYQGFLLSGETD